MAQTSADSAAIPTTDAKLITAAIDDGQLTKLAGQTHPLARAEYDRGRVNPGLVMNDLILVLKRSPERQAAFDAFVASQYDETSPNYHRWLTPEQVGDSFGTSPSDIDALCGWLRNHGFSIAEVPKDRMTIRFSGTASQVETAFHTEIHNLFVHGEKHIANMSDPSVPTALAPVVVAIKSLHNFFPHPLHHAGNRVRLNRESGRWEPVAGSRPSLHIDRYAIAALSARQEEVRPETATTLGNGLNEDVSPWDFATIYNVTPLWNEATPVNGTGQTIYIAGRSNIYATDIAAFQSTFGLKSNPVTVIVTNSNPGTGSDDDLVENTSDVEMADAIAPNAKIVLVTSASTGSSDGAYLSAEYIVNHGSLLPSTPSVMSFSYGDCEYNMISDGSNALYSSLWESAASEGLAAFVSAGDSGSAMCDGGVTGPSSSSWDVATEGLMVNGVASTPYDTAVGGTDLYWTTASTYWNTTNNSTTQANAKGYIPEQPWNDTCASPIGIYDLQAWASFLEGKGYTTAVSPTNAESACNFVYEWASTLYDKYYYTVSGDYVDIYPFVGVTGGGGGKSNCTRTETTGSGALCSGGYGKPTWQANVTGIPSDSARDLPDVSFFAATGLTSGSSYLICVSTSQVSCSNGDVATFSEIGGTSLSSPAMAGVMALINQKQGAPQGNPNPELYKLASKETYSSCSAESVSASGSCLFNDIDEGTNAPPCDPNVSPQCTRSVSSDAFGIIDDFGAGTGYDQASGLGSLNVSNVVNAWQAGLLTPTVTVTPASSSITLSQSLSVTVTVGGGSGNPTPTGSITLTSGTYSSAATTLSSGSASITIPAGSLPAGTDTLTAAYTPDSSSSATYNDASGTATVTVTGGTTPTVSVDLSSSSTTTTLPLSVSVTVSAGSNASVLLVSATKHSVSPQGVCLTHPPTGTITITSGSYSSGALTLNCGEAGASIPAGSLSIGTDTITATYTPDSSSSATYNSATGTATVTVTVGTKITPGASVFPFSSSITTSQAVGVSLYVGGGSGNPIPTGTVDLTSGSYNSGAVTLGPTTTGIAEAIITIPAGSLAVGTDTLTATYTPDSYSSGTYNSTTATATITVTSGTLTPTTSAETVSPTAITPGSTTPVVVTTTVKPASGSGTPTGTVTFFNGTAQISQVALSSGIASVNYNASTLAVGTYPITSTYSGDSNYSASSAAPVTLTVALGSTTTTASLSSSVVLVGTTAPVSITAAVQPASGSGTPTGTVTFFSNASQIGQASLSNGSATYSYAVSSLTAGTYSITVSYGGSSSYAASNSTPVTLIVSTGPITPTVSVSPASSSVTTAQSLAVEVTVGTGSSHASSKKSAQLNTSCPASSPTGSVTLTSGSYSSGAETLSCGSVSITIPADSLATGTDTLTAAYTPDSTSSPIYNSASGTASVTVTTAGAAGLTISGTAVSVTPGAAAGNTSTITVTPTNGFTGSVTLSAAITAAPTGAQDQPTLGFGGTSPVSISGTSAVTATLTVSTTAASASELRYRAARRRYSTGGMLLAFLLFGCLPLGRREGRTVLALIVLCAIMTVGMVACGGGNGSGSGGGGGGGGNTNSGTSAGTYTVTVTGTSGSTTATGTVTITVQ